MAPAPRIHALAIVFRWSVHDILCCKNWRFEISEEILQTTQTKLAWIAVSGHRIRKIFEDLSNHARSISFNICWLRSNWKLHESWIYTKTWDTQKTKSETRTDYKTKRREFKNSYINSQIRNHTYGCNGSFWIYEFRRDTIRIVWYYIRNSMTQES